jgi:hypothetical protein
MKPVAMLQQAGHRRHHPKYQAYHFRRSGSIAIHGQVVPGSTYAAMLSEILIVECTFVI